MAGAVGEYTISCDVECSIPPFHEMMGVSGFKWIMSNNIRNTRQDLQRIKIGLL